MENEFTSYLIHLHILTKVIEEYYKVKNGFRFAHCLQFSFEKTDRTTFFEVISNEREMLQDGNIPLIKMKTAQDSIYDAKDDRGKEHDR